jgi:hypothetical protein
MLGNDRLYLATLALATAKGDARARVCLAMRNIDKLNRNEFSSNPALWVRIEKLKKETSSKGSQVINGRFLKDAYEHTAVFRKKSTYSKYAKQIWEMWLETC